MKELETDILGVILESVEEVFDVKIPKIKKYRGTKDVSNAKKVYFHIARIHCFKSFSKIGLKIGKDHTTVMHGVKMCEVHLEVEPDFKMKYAKCLEMVSTGIKKVGLNKIKIAKERMSINESELHKNMAILNRLESELMLIQ